MDAMPVRVSQEIGGWAAQIEQGIARVRALSPRIAALAQGGTAAGTGVNAHREFTRVAKRLQEKTRLPFTASKNYFVSL
ncbi:MAG: lyase family protein [Bryobacterales bacterium]